MIKWIQCSKVSGCGSIATARHASILLIETGLSVEGHELRFLWQWPSRKARSSDRSLKRHSQARIVSLETPNHVAEYIIRLLYLPTAWENVRPMQILFGQCKRSVANLTCIIPTIGICCRIKFELLYGIDLYLQEELSNNIFLTNFSLLFSLICICNIPINLFMHI